MQVHRTRAYEFDSEATYLADTASGLAAVVEFYPSEQAPRLAHQWLATYQPILATLSSIPIILGIRLGFMGLSHQATTNDRQDTGQGTYNVPRQELLGNGTNNY